MFFLTILFVHGVTQEQNLCLLVPDQLSNFWNLTRYSFCSPSSEFQPELRIAIQRQREKIIRRIQNVHILGTVMQLNYLHQSINIIGQEEQCKNKFQKQILKAWTIMFRKHDEKKGQKDQSKNCVTLLGEQPCKTANYSMSLMKLSSINHLIPKQLSNRYTLW